MKRRSLSAVPGSRTAFQEALRLLAVRSRTAAEIRNILTERGFSEPDAEQAEIRLRGERLIDDEALAEEYISTRSERLGHGRGRLFRELQQRGVTTDRIRRAWDRLLQDGTLDPESILARRAELLVAREAGCLGPSAYRRIYSKLLRAGFEPAEIHRKLRPHRSNEATPGDDPGPMGMDDNAIR